MMFRNPTGKIAAKFTLTNNSSENFSTMDEKYELRVENSTNKGSDS